MRKSQDKYLEYAKLIKERLTILIEKITDGNQKSFAVSIDATDPTISEWLGNKKNSIPSAYYMIRICEAHKVNINWLLTGKGEMLIEPNQKKTIQQFEDEKRKIFQEPDMCILLYMIQKLNTDERKKLINLISVCFDQELVDCENNKELKEIKR